MRYQDRFETERLVIRRTLAGDAEGIRAYAVYKTGTGYEPWEKWPTDGESCREIAEHSSRQENAWAVERREDGAYLGFVSFNTLDEAGQLDMGHGFIYPRLRPGEAAEALGRMVEYAFSLEDVSAVEARNPEDWAEQVAPVLELGFVPYRQWRILYRPGQSENSLET